MSRWSVWQIGRGGAVERVGTYTSGADARRVLRATILAGAAVDPDGEVSEARGVAPAHVTAIEAAAEAWLASVPTMPAPPAAIEIPAPEEHPAARVEGVEGQEPVRLQPEVPVILGDSVDVTAQPAVFGSSGKREGHPVDDGHPVGTGSTTEAARAAALRAEIARVIRVVGAATMPTLPDMPDSTGIPLRPFTSPAFREALHAAKVAGPLHDEIERLEVALADATARAVAAEEATARMRAVLDGVRATAAALDTRAERAESERDALASSLRERSEQLDAARRDIAARDRTIAKLLAAKAHPVVRIAPKPGAVRKAAGETPVGTLFRVIRERARGVR